MAEGPGAVEVLARVVAATGGDPREGQARMAAAVASAIEHGRHLLVQAGTGTGKSWAYLVPALLAGGAGSRVVVATSTLALQAQLVRKDLPRLAEAVGEATGRRPQWALLKGRHNYACKHRLAGAGASEGEQELWSDGPGSRTALESEVARVRAWAGDTATGDRDDLPGGVSERAWRAVSVTARECLTAARCPQGAECFAELARRRAREADVVVTNHALLAIDAADRPGTLPEHDVVVVDEAHDLADRVTGALAVELSAAAVATASASARAAGAGTADLDAAARSLATALEGCEPGLVRGELPRPLADALTLVSTAARTASRGITGEGEGTPSTRAQSARASLAEVAETAVRLLGTGTGTATGTATGTGTATALAGPASGDTPSDTPVDTGAQVVWVEADDGRGAALHAAPLSVAAMLADRVLSERTVVLTSATLAPGGDFGITARRLGLTRGGDWEGLDVGSPFDYRRQAILYVAAHLPPPGRDDHASVVHDEIHRLVTASDGGTLGLFSSRRAAQLAAADLRRRTDLPVLCQGEGASAALVAEFAGDDRACLFGTLGLWQGVDVPGSSCRLVLIDRIPFPRPDDPMTQARTAAADRAGGSGFAAVSLPHAATLLAQGAGRLIRSPADRGVVAVLDSRLVTKQYGATLSRAMPGMWRTTDPDVATAALARLATASVPV